MGAIGSIFGWALKGGKWTLGALGIGAAAVGVDYAATGGSVTGGLVRGAGSQAGNALAEPASNTEVAAKKFGFYEMVQWFGEVLQLLGVGGGIPQTIMNFAENGAAKTRDPNASLASAGVTPGGNPGAGAPGAGGPSAGGSGGTDPENGGGWGTTALVGTAGAATLVGGGVLANRYMQSRTPALSSVAGGADDAYTAMQGQLGAADDVARTAGRFGRWGKIAAIGATVVGGGAALLSGSPAEASTLTSAATAAGGGLTANANNNGGSISTMGADVAGLGLSILGGKAAATATASVAAPALASLGIKAIPGIASIYAAGEGIYNTASYALKGEWGKAGLSLVSGVGETVAGLGGAATYLTVGTAWREAVRAGGAMAFGEENTIEHSTVVNLGSYLKDQFFGATTNTANAPAPQVLAPRTNAPVLAF